MEQLAIYLWFAGLVVTAIGFAWLVIAAFRQRVLWGIGTLVFPPLGFLFLLLHWTRAHRPFLVAFAGWVTVGAAYGVQRVSMDLGPREKIVEGELHITLTGWDRGPTGYTVLKGKPQTVVLQMANPDVTDQTLEWLRDMKLLRELDLNDTQVTDQGLPILKELPSLQAIRLKNTQISDQGFQQYLEPKESLLMLDLRGTDVHAETVRNWRAAKSGRRVLR